MFLLLQLGLLFLAFDANHRHDRARIGEVLGSRPITNFESLAGRLIGISTLLWLVIAANVLALHCFGLICQVFEYRFAEPIQPHSIFNLLVLDVPATLLAWCALVVFLGSVFRSRFAVIAVGSLLMLAYYFLVLRTPFSLLPVLSPSSNDSHYISDIVPEIASFTTIFVRVASVIGAFLLIVLATTFTTRRDGSNRLVKAIALSLLLFLTGAFVTVATLDTTQKLGQIADWREIHESYLWNGSVDVSHISGDVHIDPEKHLTIDLTLSFETVLPPEEKLVFTLNPSMTIHRLTINEHPAEFSFNNGLLEISPPILLQDQSVQTLGIKAEGIPNPRFAYLNSALDYQSDPDIRARTVKLFGTEGSIYSRSYVGLMPGVYWYPIPGAAKSSSFAAGMDYDYFDVDLTVAIKRDDWDLVASGAIPEYSDGKYSVITDAPVSQIGLLASSFENVVLDIDGIEFSITLHQRHAKNLVLADNLTSTIKDQVGLILKPLAHYGLNYPSDFLNLVEVPSRLRTVGGGWRMDTANTLPGIVLLKEHGYPTAPIHQNMDLEKLWGYSGDEITEGQVRVVFLFFQHSVGPDNPWSSFPHRYWTQVTAASGEHAQVLDQTALAILSQLTYTWDFFSVYSTLYIGDMIVLNPFTGYSSTNLFRNNRIGLPQLFRLWDIEEKYGLRSSVRGHVESTSLDVLPSSHGSQKDIEHLLFRTEEIAKGLEVINGRGKLLRWLADLRNTYSGTTYTHFDLLDLAEQHGVVVEPFLTEWITADDVPGYIYTAPSVIQVSNDDQGNSRFQTTLDIRNVRPTAGYIQLDYEDSSSYISSPGIIMNGLTSKRINLVTPSPPEYIYLETGLSLNRDSTSFGEQSEEVLAVKSQLDVSPADFEQESDWIPAFQGIVVDDLDPGFHAFQKTPEKKKTNMPYFLGGLFEPSLGMELDQGLPIKSWNQEDRLVGIWQRSENSGAFGTFRKTYVTAVNSNGIPRIRFSAKLPSTGSWQLEYLIPEIFVSFGQSGDINLVVTNRGDSSNLTVEGETLDMGWNLVGTFDLEEGDVHIDFVDSSRPETLYVDAIRWTEVDSDKSAKSN